jgi:hypothetical protein
MAASVSGGALGISPLQVQSPSHHPHNLHHASGGSTASRGPPNSPGSQSLESSGHAANNSELERWIYVCMDDSDIIGIYVFVCLFVCLLVCLFGLVLDL